MLKGLGRSVWMFAIYFEVLCEAKKSGEMLGMDLRENRQIVGSSATSTTTHLIISYL